MSKPRHNILVFELFRVSFVVVIFAPALSSRSLFVSLLFLFFLTHPVERFATSSTNFKHLMFGRLVLLRGRVSRIFTIFHSIDMQISADAATVCCELAVTQHPRDADVHSHDVLCASLNSEMTFCRTFVSVTLLDVLNQKRSNVES